MANISTAALTAVLNGMVDATTSAGYAAATTNATFTVADAKNFGIFCVSQDSTAVTTVTIAASTALRYAGKGIGAFTTTIVVSGVTFIGPLESARFASSAKTINATFSTACKVVGIQLP